MVAPAQKADQYPKIRIIDSTHQIAQTKSKQAEYNS
jgi:hypothetical protein